MADHNYRYNYHYDPNLYLTSTAEELNRSSTVEYAALPTLAERDV
jgi:hypothetical protein